MTWIHTDICVNSGVGALILHHTQHKEPTETQHLLFNIHDSWFNYHYKNDLNVSKILRKENMFKLDFVSEGSSCLSQCFLLGLDQDLSPALFGLILFVPAEKLLWKMPCPVMRSLSGLSCRTWTDLSEIRFLFTITLLLSPAAVPAASWL